MNRSTDDWTLDHLNRAYQKGYMAGLCGRPPAAAACYSVDVLNAAWEAGFEDGNARFHIHEVLRDLESREHIAIL